MNVADYAPFVGSIGGGFAAGALVGFAIKQVLKIAAVIVGLFLSLLWHFWSIGESSTLIGIESR
jgi:uncharacterized membrane protein (Fun14 family)